jgi:hypothetical protein
MNFPIAYIEILLLAKELGANLGERELILMKHEAITSTQKS